MKFDPPLQKAILLRRYKRFLADIRLEDGEICTIHCPNTGSMKNCIVDNSDCWYSVSDNPKRKYPFTWEIASTPAGHLAGVNTHRANQLVREAIENNVITTLENYTSLLSEVKYGCENSRIDFLLQADDKPDCYVEVKNVTLESDSKNNDNDGRGYFPDAVSTRGTKHLRELMTMIDSGQRAVLLFCVQHTGITSVTPADHIDPTYGQTLRTAMSHGVEVLAYQAIVSDKEIVLHHALPVIT